MDKSILNLFETIVVGHEAFRCGLADLSYYYEMKQDGHQKGIGIAVLGESGTGKTTLIEKFIESYPKVETETQTISPIALVTIPTRPMGSSLCNAILEGLGDTSRHKKEDVPFKVRRIIHLLKKCETKALVLDEMQHFVNRWNGRDAHDAGDTLKLILDGADVMLVCAGLEYGASLFKQNEQLLRRFSRNIKLERFDWNDEASRIQFKGMLQTIETKMQPYFTTVDLSSNEMAFRLFVASGGITGYVKEIIKEAALRVYYSGNSEISLAHYASAYSRTEFALLEQGSISNPFLKEIHTSNLARLLNQSKKVGVSEVDKAVKLGKAHLNKAGLSGASL